MSRYRLVCGCALCSSSPTQDFTGLSRQKTTVLAAPHSGDYRIDVLFARPEDKWFPEQGVGRTAALTYSFAATPGYLTGSDAAGFLPFNDAQKTATREILQRLSQEVGLTFTEVDEAGGSFGQIRFANNDQGPQSAGYAYFPNEAGEIGGDVFMNGRIPETTLAEQNVRGTDVYVTLVHEILHALGISHPGNYNAEQTSDPTAQGNFLIETEDNMNNTLMSYYRPLDDQGQHREFLGPYDLLALGHAYGRQQVRTGDDVYEFTDASGLLRTLISDTGGVDSIDLANLTLGAEINLQPGASSSLGRALDGDLSVSSLQLAFDAVIENVVGTPFGDRIVGGDGRNVVTPGLGNDEIDGGGGLDTVAIAASRAQVTITAQHDVLTVSFGAETDVLQNVERIRFDDVTLALDTDGSAGQAYRVYQAAFARTPDTGGLSFWVGRMDNGTSLIDVAAGFVSSSEFRSVYGAAPTFGEIVAQFYRNVLGREGEAGGVDFWTGELQRGVPVQNILAGFSESAENKAALVSVIGSGIVLDTVSLV